MKLKGAYKRRYKMRAQGQDGLNTVVSIPRVVIEREANKKNLTVEEFIKSFRAIAHYNNFDGVFYAFEKDIKEVKNGDTGKNKTAQQD